jgi:hypothetical protein
MTKYYSDQTRLPAAAITYAGMNNAIQPILFTTQYGYKDNFWDMDRLSKLYPKSDWTNIDSMIDRPLCWVIKSVKVTTVRDWSVSTAQIILTINLPEVSDRVPNLPDLSSYRGGNYPYLTYEDEIRIYAGWIDGPTTPICADLLDQYPIDLCPEGLGNDSNGNPICAPEGEYIFKTDHTRPLAPIFWGFIDTVNVIVDKGVQCILHCRDRARIFSDTKIISIPSLQGSQLFDKSQKPSDEGSGGLATGNRDQILLQVAQAATGATLIEQDNKSCWRRVIGDPKKGAKKFTGYSNIGTSAAVKNTPPADPAGWVRAAMFKIMHPEAAPRFHMWVQRPPYRKGNGSAVFQILDKSPIEIIRYLGDTEERFTDFYASHVNGDFIFAPSSIDTSGFYDPNRMYRTYFFKTYPKDQSDSPPLSNQMIIDMRVASSSLGTFNRYVVVDSQSGGTYGDFMDNIQMAIEANNWNLEGRKVTPPCRNNVLYDGNLSSYEGNPAGAALIVGLAQARRFSRELAAIQMTVLGDPTFYPGEAVRIYNSILHDFATSVNPGTKKSIELLEEQQRRWESLSDESNKTIFDAAGTSLKNPASNEIAREEIKKLQIGRLPTGDLVLPVYKIRSIQHNIFAQGNESGYTTKVEMIADY